MPLLRWNPYEFIECLEAIPEIEEDEVEHRFQLTRNGLMLSVDVWQYESTLQFTLRQEQLVDPLINFALVVREGVRHLKRSHGVECLQFANCIVVPSRFSYLDSRGKDIFDVTQVSGMAALRLLVNPAIRFELMRDLGPF